MAGEARTMEFLRRAGYPVPAVEEISDDGLELVLERIDGVSMVEAIGRAPWTVRRQARTLADLHTHLHQISAPEFLDGAPLGSGNQVIHLDLHPLNVMIGPKGPVVIDWTGACAGDPDIDVGIAWLLMAAGEIPGNSAKAKLLGIGRRLLVNGFLADFDLGTIVPKLRSIVEWKVQDPHMSGREVELMWRVVDETER